MWIPETAVRYQSAIPASASFRIKRSTIGPVTACMMQESKHVSLEKIDYGTSENVRDIGSSDNTHNQACLKMEMMTFLTVTTKYITGVITYSRAEPR